MLQNVSTNGTEVEQTGTESMPQVTAREVRGRPFAKGNPHRFRRGDPRINLKGRPKSFDQFRGLLQGIAEEELSLSDGRKITVAEAMARKCAKSDEPALIRLFFEYAFGKVPDKLEATGLENKTTLVLHFDHEKGISAQ